MHRIASRALIVLIALSVVLALPLAAHASPGRATQHAPLYYLSLGDSLAAGVQPDASGSSVPTNAGYADQLYASAKAEIPNLVLVKLGCPGETTGTMINGGICSYARGSQLAAAVNFIHAHKTFIAFVTLDIGANDIDGCISNGAPDLACIGAGFASTGANIPTIMSALRAAGGSAMPIAGMSLYDPFLAAWLSGPAGQTLATVSVPLAVQFNNLLGGLFTAGGATVADVMDAFATTDFTLVSVGPFVNVPHNVVNICFLTWMCAPAPQGPNIHANAAGYGVIADAFEAVLPL